MSVWPGCGHGIARPRPLHLKLREFATLASAYSKGLCFLRDELGKAETSIWGPCTAKV